jgi:uncharacterized protein (UPF0548 family)
MGSSGLGSRLTRALPYHRRVDVLLPGQVPKLERWEARPFSPGVEAGPGARDRRDDWRREVAREPRGAPLPDGPFARVAAAILRYDIFPPALVTGVLRRAPVAVGDTVGILYRRRLFFAARVIARDAASFTYRTLAGHPELGEERFAVEKDADSGAVVVSLRSWSRPGIAVARAFAPLVRLVQVRASRAALAHLAEVARWGQ